MAINFKKIWNGVTVVPKAASTSDLLGELETLSSDSKLYFHNGTTNSPIVTESHSATLTNKTLTSPVINTGVSGTAIDIDGTLAANSDTLLASQKAVKTYVDTSTGAVQTDVNDLVTLSGVAVNSTNLGTFTGTTIPDASTIKSALQSLETTLDGHIADTVDAHDASAISSVPSGNLAATDVQGALNELQSDIDTRVAGPASATDEAIVRFDLTTGKLVQNSVVTITDAGVAAGLTGLTSSGTVSSTGTLAVGGDLTESITTDNATTGANATITNPATSFLRLTNASLTSIDMISAPVAGEVITIVNATGVDITINNDLGGTAANRILTGTKANLTLKDEASIIVKYDSTESRWMVIGGTGAGSGSGINYILSSDGGSTTGWATYADAAASVPVDGTGGAPNVTFATTTSSPLVETSSFLFTKDAANRQGEGVSYAFTIDAGYQAQVLRISFPYSASANYADTVSGNLINSDMQVFIYDVTNSQLISVTEQNIGASSQGQYVGTFQTSSNSTSYRLILHVASTNANAYTLKLDNVVVGPQTLSKGPIITDWQSYTTTTGLTGGTTSFTGMYRRVGKEMEVRIEATFTSVFTGGTASFSLPSGFTIDTAAFSTTPTSGFTTLGPADLVDITVSAYRGIVTYDTTSVVRVRYLSDDAGAASDALLGSSVTTTAPFTWANGDKIILSFSVPIVGWSSNVVLSEDAGNRLIVARAALTTAQTGITNKVIPFNNVIIDTTASFNSTTGIFTSPESGYYKVTASALYDALDGASLVRLQLRKNGTAFNDSYMSRLSDNAISTAYGSTSDIVFLSKGDTLQVYAVGDASFDISNNGNITNVSIEKISSPQTLAGSETVAARYTTNTAQSVTDTNVILYEDLAYDTHNAYNTSTGLYTVPVSGKYLVVASIRTASVAAGAIGQHLELQITAGGVSSMTTSDTADSTTSRQFVSSGSSIFNLTKGQTIGIYFSETLPAVNTDTSATFNYLCISKIG